MLPAIDEAQQQSAIDAAEAEAERLRAEIDRRADRIKGIAERLERQAQEVVGQRQQLEDDWLEDLRNYYGRYDDETEARLRREKKSRVFVRKPLSLCRHWISKLSDLLFPVDEDNWSIRPTPVPELTNDLARLEPGSEQALAAQKQLDEAKAASLAMGNEMRDQLRQSRYNARSRDCIDDCVILGTGIMKGPVSSGALTRWQAMAEKGWARRIMPDKAPKFVRVDPWNFFPDPTATSAEDTGFTYERHLPTAKELRRWAREGFNAAAIRNLLEAGARGQIPSYIETVAMIVNGRASNVKDRFVVWEYRGPITGEELRDVCIYMGQSAVWDAVANTMPIDPLDEIQVVMWICQGEVLQFGLHPLDSQANVYSVWPFLRDTSSIFGWGVPRITRDDSAALNSAWRMVLDNGGLSTGPQIVINKSIIEPSDGDWALKPQKPWLIKSDAPTNQPPFQTFHIDSRQTELLNIVTTADAMANESAGLPPQTQGEPGTMQTTAASGIAMLLQNAAVVFRHVVRNFDDDLTVPNITRLYEWNMQHGTDDRIKGDMKVDARGSSELLVREITAQNLSLILDKYAANPATAPLIKVPETFRSMVRQMGIAADDIVKTDDEIAQEQATTEPAPPDPETLRLQLQLQIAQQDSQTRLQVAAMERDTEMFKLAATQNMKMDELRAMMTSRQMEFDHKERSQAAETAFKRDQSNMEIAVAAQHATGRVDIPDGTRFAP